MSFGRGRCTVDAPYHGEPLEKISALGLTMLRRQLLVTGRVREAEPTVRNGMRSLSSTTWVMLAALGLGVGFLTTADRSMAGEHQPSGWYLATGAGVTRAAGMEQSGWNRDTTCYPNDDCGHLTGGAPTGYRWFYDLRADRGTAAEIAIGRRLGPLRLEAALTQRRNGVGQAFTGITYLDGSRLMPAADSDYESSSTRSVDDLTTRTLSLNAYHDVRIVESPITPYVGAGLGISFVELAGLYYESMYHCKADVACDDPGQYDGRQDVAVSDVVPSGHLYVGANMAINPKFLVDLKLSYSMVGDIEDEDAYAFHKVPNLTSTTSVSDIRQWSLMLGVRYGLGR